MDPRKPKPKLYGKETPRLFTPPLRELTPDVLAPDGVTIVEPATTLGFAVIEFADQVLRLDLFPWQRWLLIHALELREDGSLRFRNVLVLVGRQNGKSTVSQVLALWWIFVAGCRTVLATAQDLDTAEDVWEGAVELATGRDPETDEPLRPELYWCVKHVIRTNGKKSLLLKTRERYKVKAASRKAGRGLTGDRIILDELREHTTWDAWGAITKTTMARPDAQVWMFSNAGDAQSVVLAYLRKIAHRALGDPDRILIDDDEVGGPDEFDLEQATEYDEDLEDLEVDDLEVDDGDLFLAEWSAPRGCRVTDREAWAQANPSMGWTIAAATIASAARTDPEWVFRTEVLCQWPDGLIDGKFKPEWWQATTNPLVTGPDGELHLAGPDRIVGEVAASIDMSFDRSRTWIAFCGDRADGLPQAEVVAVRTGSAWVKQWLMDRRDRIVAVTGQATGATVSGLLRDLAEDPRFTIPVVPLGGTDLPAAAGDAVDRLRDRRIWHNPQPPLDEAAKGVAAKNLGDGWVINRRASIGDAAPLQAWVGAVWLWTKPRKTQPPPPPAPKSLAGSTQPSRRTGEPNLATVGF